MPSYFQTDANRNVGIVYMGPKLSDKQEYSQVTAMYKQTSDYTGVANAAYATAGTRNLFEPAIAVTHADGNNSSTCSMYGMRPKNWTRILRCYPFS